MSESTQHKLDRVRKPRVQLTYDVEIGDATQIRELPFVMGIIANLSGKSEVEHKPLKDRKFIEIDRDNYNDVMASIAPRVAYTLPDTLSGGGATLGVDITFKSLDSFNPVSIVKNIPKLSKIYKMRTQLNDLLAKLDGNDNLYQLLSAIMTDKAKAADLKKQIDAAMQGK